MLAVLHTWGQNLALHPHVHCVVTGGGLSPDGSRWVAGRDDFFLPVRVLSRVFRGKFLAGLRAAFERGRLRFPGELGAAGAARTSSNACSPRRSGPNGSCTPSRRSAGPRQVLKYLARYTHRAAISNRRLVGLADGQVTLPLEGLRPRRQAGDHDARRRSSSSAGSCMHVLPVGVRAGPALRAAGQPPPPGEAGAVPGIARHGRDAAGRHGPDRSRSGHAAGPRSDGDPDPGLSPVWRGPDGRGRGIPADAHGRGDRSGPRTVPDLDSS